MPPPHDEMPWNLTVAEIVGRLELLLAQPAVAEEYVRLRIALVEAQQITFEDLEDSPLVPLSVAALDAKRHCLYADQRSSGQSACGADRPSRPIIEPRDIGFDQAIALRLFASISRECRRYGAVEADLEKLTAAVWDRPKLLAGFVRYGACWIDVTYPEKLAVRLAVPEEMLLFLGRLVAAPFVAHAARRLRREPIGLFASQGPCPMCGATPGLATLAPDEGHRMLHCSLCGQVWPFDRLRCPFCTRQSPSGLTRLSTTPDAARWIEACDECHHYLRVTDLRRRGVGRPLVPLAEETAGLGLDLVAEQAGYLRKPPYVAIW